MLNYVRQVLNPTWYHGHVKSAPFFEGWYFKCVSADQQHKWAFIPGVFIHDDPTRSHAFIQVLNGTTGEAFYHAYDITQFAARQNAFDVSLGNSRFQINQLVFDVDDDLGNVKGELNFGTQHPWPVSLWSPGVMGWYGWLPFLECYHGICSLDHNISGSLTLYGQHVDFTGGRGYIEKDWGQSFPRGYVWQQSNHFGAIGTSLTASFATVPNVGRTFAGYIVGLWHEERLYQFTTYNGSKLNYLHVNDTSVEWSLTNRHHALHVRALRAEGGLLLGPEREAMHKRVDETLKSHIELELFVNKGNQQELILKDTGRHAALEVVGDLRMIVTA